jgi:hypothetical protein
MTRKIVLVFVMGLALTGAAATGTSFPVLLLMVALLLVALVETSARNEEQE